MTYLDQLKAEREAITGILQAHRTAQPVSPGTQMTIGIYVQILEDALSTLNSLILFMETTNN